MSPKIDGRKWVTPAQETWLNEQLPNYLAASAKNQYHKLWPSLYQSWFKRFPEPPPTSDDLTDSEHESDFEDENDSPDPDFVAATPASNPLPTAMDDITGQNINKAPTSSTATKTRKCHACHPHSSRSNSKRAKVSTSSLFGKMYAILTWRIDK